MRCTLAPAFSARTGTTSIENAVAILLSSPSELQHDWRKVGESDQFPWGCYPGSEEKWPLMQADVNQISTTLDSQYQVGLFMRVVKRCQHYPDYHRGFTIWNPMHGNTTRKVQTDWYKKHQELLQKDCHDVPPYNGGVQLQFRWEPSGASIEFQVALRLVYPCPPETSEVFVVDISNRRTMSVEKIRQLAEKAEKHTAWLNRTGGAQSFKGPLSRVDKESSVVNSWLPPHTLPPLDLSSANCRFLFSLASASFPPASLSPTTAAPASSFASGSTPLTASTAPSTLSSINSSVPASIPPSQSKGKGKGKGKGGKPKRKPPSPVPTPSQTSDLDIDKLIERLTGTDL